MVGRKTMITIEGLNAVNKTLKTTDVKGKPYVEVNERIRAFRSMCPSGSITTEILSMADGIVTMKATVCDEEGNVLGTGLAQEKESSSYINKTSYIENCETSAVGRALGMCGIGIDGSVASAEEVGNAIANQNEETERTKLMAFIAATGRDAKAIAKEYGLSRGTTEERFKEVHEILFAEDIKE